MSWGRRAHHAPWSAFAGWALRRHYRSKIWRGRLDATTNWAVATSGIALSVSFSSAETSALPNSSIPSRRTESGWNQALASDYDHIRFWEAAGRRLRRNYVWIFLIQTLSYLAKIIIHPTPAQSFGELLARAAIGPLSGTAVLLGGLAFHTGLLALALVTLERQRATGRVVLKRKRIRWSSSICMFDATHWVPRAVVPAPGRQQAKRAAA